MPRPVGFTKLHVVELHVLLHKLSHFWGNRRDRKLLRFHDIAELLTDYTHSYITKLCKGFTCGETCTAEDDLNAAKAPHVTPSTQRLMDTTEHVLQEASTSLSVHECVRRVNAELAASDEGVLVMSTQRCYRVLKMLRYSSKKTSRVIGVFNPDVQSMQRLDMTALRAGLRQITDMRSLVFVDECSLNASSLVLEQRRIAPTGERSFATSVPPKKEDVTSFTAIVFLSLSEDVQVFTLFDNNTAEIFDDMVRRFMDFTRIPHVHFLLDNATVHSKTLMAEFAEERDDLSYSFLPRYCPDTNAAESVHHKLKTSIRHELEQYTKGQAETMRQVTLGVVRSFTILPEVREKMIRHAIDVLSLMPNLSYKEASNQVKRSKKLRRQ